MAVIEVTNLVKEFNGVRAVDDMSLTVDESEILVIMGASGCGKTTTLRCIAGLEEPTSGIIKIDGKTVVDDETVVPPEKRGIGMVFQSYALWPHKTVFENVAYGLSVAGISKQETATRVMVALNRVGLERMAERYPSTLSGGQQQRVALARSAATRPKVLLFDEPLSNLDAKLREQMRVDLRNLIKDLNMTALYITHDQTEAMAIADKVIYMREGRVVQRGTPKELYRQPNSRAVAEFVGNATFLDARVVLRDGSSLEASIKDRFTLRSTIAGESVDSDIVIAIRPESIDMSTVRPSDINVLEGTIVSETFLGDRTEYHVDVGGENIICADRSDFPQGSRVYLRVRPDDVICLKK